MSTIFQPPETPVQPPVYRTPPPPGAQPWYRRLPAWAVVLVALLFAVTALFAVTLSSLGDAHGQLGKLQSQYAASRAANGKLQSQYAASRAANGSLAAQLAAQQGKALLGSWKVTSNGATYTQTFKADHTLTLSGGGGNFSGYWAIGAPGRLILDDEGMGPAYPASEGGGNSDAGFAPTFTIHGNTLTLTYGSGSSATIETYTRSSGTGVLGGRSARGPA